MSTVESFVCFLESLKIAAADLSGTLPEFFQPIGNFIPSHWVAMPNARAMFLGAIRPSIEDSVSLFSVKLTIKE
jgi:hypothetical protein